MDASVARQFLDFVQDFLNLCQWKNWPNNDTTEVEFKNAFHISLHVEKCLDKFQKNGLLDEFLSSLDSIKDAPHNGLTYCLSDPPKFLLKKIINSEAKIPQLDMAFKIFMQLFTEDKLENCLTEFMIEKASKETLLQNLSIELSREQILKFKSELLLIQINEDTKDIVLDMLSSKCKQETIDLLVLTLCNTEIKYLNSVNIISNCLLEILLRKQNSYKHFWHLLLNVEDRYFIQMCVEHSSLYKYLCEALIDCGKLLKENISAQYFYIDLNYSELVTAIRKLSSNEQLKSQFLDIVKENDADYIYWLDIIS